MNPGGSVKSSKWDPCWEVSVKPWHRSLPVAGGVQEALEEVLLSFQFLGLSFRELFWQKQKWMNYGAQLKGAGRSN